MKPIVYLMNVLGLAPFILQEKRGFRKFMGVDIYVCVQCYDVSNCSAR